MKHAMTRRNGCGYCIGSRGKREARQRGAQQGLQARPPRKDCPERIGTSAPGARPERCADELVTGAVADYVAQNEADWDEAVSYAQAFRDRLRASARRPLPGHA